MLGDPGPPGGQLPGVPAPSHLVNLFPAVIIGPCGLQGDPRRPSASRELPGPLASCFSVGPWLGAPRNSQP